MLNLSNLTLQKKLLLALAAGLLNWAAFPKVGLWPLVWICQAPLMLASFREPSSFRALLFGTVAGLAFFVGTVHWIAGVLLNYGGLPWLGAEILFLLLALYLSSYYALFSWTFARLSLLAPSLCFWLAPALWVGTEYMRAQILTGFPWCLLGYGLVDAFNISQIATWTGVYGLSFAAVSVSAFIAEILLRPSRFAVMRLSGAAALTLGLGLGLRMGKEPVKPVDPVRIVQTNIDLDQKWDTVTKSSLLDELAKLSVPSEPRQGNTPSDSVHLILWPETPAAFYFNHDPDFRRRMQNIATAAGAYFFFGFVDFRPRSGGNAERDPYNSVAMLSPDGRAISQYDKVHLVPFGEYIPYQSLFFFVDKISTEAGNFRPGSRVVVTPLDNQRSAGTFVCYEAVVPDLVRQFAREGSQLFVNVTNDAWFGESAAPFQHLAMARMRAIENHRYLLRAANNGISAIIDPAGRVVNTVPRNQRTFLEGHFSFETQMTVYSQYGDIFAWLCLFTGAAALTWLGTKERRDYKSTAD